MYHGTHEALALHEGLCLALEADVAAAYARQNVLPGETPTVHTVEVALDGLRVVEVPGYDRDLNYAPGDEDEDVYDDVDVLVYADEDVHGRQHTTWRLMTERALAAARVVTSRPVEVEEGVVM